MCQGRDPCIVRMTGTADVLAFGLGFLCLTLFLLHFVSLCVRVTVVAFHVHVAAGCALRLSQLHK